MNATETDYTGKMGPLSSGKEWPMYSFERPAYLFWNAFANQLAREGFSERQIQTALQGRDVRHMLDTDQDAIEEVGRTLASFYKPTRDIVK
jgi:hypothetical protein